MLNYLEYRFTRDYYIDRAYLDASIEGDDKEQNRTQISHNLLVLRMKEFKVYFTNIESHCSVLEFG